MPAGCRSVRGTVPEHAEQIVVDQSVQLLHATLDLVGGRLDQPLRRERLDRERSHRGATGHRLPQHLAIRTVETGEQPEEPTRERVACSGRVGERHHGVGRRQEPLIVRVVQRTVLALLDDHGMRTLCEQRLGRSGQVGLAGERPRLFFVQQRDIDPPQHLEHPIGFARDPVVHRVGEHETRLPHLRQDLQLEVRIDVRQEHVRHAALLVRELGMEVREHVQLGLERVRMAQLGHVLATPAERAPLGRLQPGEIDAPARERRAMALGEVLPHHRHDRDRREVARGAREVGGRSAERLDDLAIRRLDAVQGDRAHDQDALRVHARTSSLRSSRSGAETPMSARPLRRTWAEAAHRRRRCRLTAGCSGSTTRQA